MNMNESEPSQLSYASQISRFHESEFLIKTFYAYVIALKIKLGGSADQETLQNF